MMSVRSTLRSLNLLVLVSAWVLAWPGTLNASDQLYGVFFDNSALTPTERLVTVDATTGTVADVGALLTDCCLISSGVSTIDPVGDVFYFVGARQSDSGNRRIFSLDLATGGILDEQLLPTTNNYNFLEFDIDTGTLYAVVFENTAVTPTEKLVTINPATGAVTDVGALILDCCLISSGISALDTTLDVFYFIGSRQSDSLPRIFTLDLVTGAVLDEEFLPTTNNYNFLEIDPDSGVLYGVVFDTTAVTPTEKLVTINPADGTVTDAGAVITDCCGISSGISALNSNGDVFYFLGSRQSDATGARRIFTLDLATGNVLDEEVLPTTDNHNFLEFDPTFAVNQPPVAVCTDIVLSADAACQADGSIDAGSFDPEGGALSLSQSPAGPYGLGDTLVTLTVEDDLLQQDSCQGTVTVVDDTPPVVSCGAPATIKTTDAPISFTATAMDNCAGTTVEIIGFDCYSINGAGKRVDKKNSCVVTLDGDTIHILDSGGVGNVITWTARATDGDGNTVDEACSVSVVKP